MSYVMFSRQGNIAACGWDPHVVRPPQHAVLLVRRIQPLLQLARYGALAPPYES